MKRSQAAAPTTPEEPSPAPTLKHRRKETVALDTEKETAVVEEAAAVVEEAAAVVEEEDLLCDEELGSVGDTSETHLPACLVKGIAAALNAAEFDAKDAVLQGHGSYKKCFVLPDGVHVALVAEAVMIKRPVMGFKRRGCATCNGSPTSVCPSCDIRERLVPLTLPETVVDQTMWSILSPPVGTTHTNIARLDIVIDCDATCSTAHKAFVAARHDGDLYTLCRLTPRLTAVQAVGITMEVAAGLAFMHASNVMHRDLKPGNVLVTADQSHTHRVPKVAITDFGAASFVSDCTSPKVTSAQLMEVTTAPYTGPEAFLKGVTAYCAGVDVYALGAIMYECLAGSPFMTFPREVQDKPVTVALMLTARLVSLVVAATGKEHVCVPLPHHDDCPCFILSEASGDMKKEAALWAGRRLKFVRDALGDDGAVLWASMLHPCMQTRPRANAVVDSLKALAVPAAK